MKIEYNKTDRNNVENNTNYTDIPSYNEAMANELPKLQANNGEIANQIDESKRDVNSTFNENTDITSSTFVSQSLTQESLQELNNNQKVQDISLASKGININDTSLSNPFLNQDENVVKENFQRSSEIESNHFNGFSNEALPSNLDFSDNETNGVGQTQYIQPSVNINDNREYQVIQQEQNERIPIVETNVIPENAYSSNGVNKELKNSNPTPKKPKNKLLYLLLLFIVLGGGISLIFVFKNNMADKAKTNNDNVQTEEQKDNEEDQENNEPEVNDSFIIEGVEYVDTSRNFKDVNSNKFSFFIDNNRENYLTYINNNEDSKVKLSMVDNKDNSVCAVFTFYNNGLQSDIIVSNEDYMLNNKKVIGDNKTPLWTEERYTSYIAPYNSSFYINQFVVKIDNIEFSIFVLSKKSGDENVKATIEELIDCLSVNKKVGFYMDWFLSYGSMSNITLKSYKNIGYIVVQGKSGKNPNKIIINGNIIDYQGAMYSWENSEILEKNQVYGKWENMNVGYYTSNYSFGDSLIIYIYGATKEIDAKEYFVDSPYLFEVQKYQESGMTEQEVIKLLLDHLVKYVR